ncbi:MAG TPA: peptidylprolyl isomerase, partial [Gemmiger formicilis]|nr:peptidylprolyl isomerase [Gemmiger formicilis]
TGRCAMCHAKEPGWEGIVTPPKGVMLETDAQIAAYAAVGGLPYLDNTDTVFGQVYQGMDVVDAMACVDTVKDDDGNDTYRPTEEAAITINSVTITTYSSAEDNGLDTVG